MNDILNIQGPAVREEQLIELYRTNQTQPSPWRGISDQVMGSVSSASVHQDERQNASCSCLVGRTRLDNNGGFVQMRLEIEPDWLRADYQGVFIELYGNAQDYNLHVKTTQLTRPWQSFRCTLSVEPLWTRFIVPYDQLHAHRTDAELQPTSIRSVAVVAIGKAFDVDVCVRRFGFYLGC